MSLVVIPNPLTNGTTAYGSDVIADINAIASDYNGNIQDVNIAAGANIQNSKLAQIVNASMVNGTALTGLGNIPSGAGIIPTANLPGGGSTPGSLLALSNKYVFNFTGVTTLPTAGAIYTNNSQAFTVTSSTGVGLAGALYGAVYCTGSAAPTPTGALVKSSGTGDASITYSQETAQLPALDGSLLTNIAGLISVTSYGSSYSSGTAISQGQLKIYYGQTGSIGGNSSATITGLAFTSGSTYSVTIAPYSTFNMVVSGKSGTQFTLTNTHNDDVGGNGNGDWMAIGY